jgi:hypothetical protein
VIAITFQVLLWCEYRTAPEVGTRLLPDYLGPDRMYHMRPLPSGQGPFFSPPSEPVTPSARPSLNLLQTRASIPLVSEFHTMLAGDKCALLALNESGFDLSRLLRERLMVLAAALQRVKELQRNAADAPAGLQ